MAGSLTADGIGTRRDLAVERAAQRAQAYAAARRHSRLVHVLRKAIPAAMALVVVGMTARTFWAPFAPPASRVEIEAYNLSGSTVTMESPKLQGYKKDGRPYQLDADKAQQDVRKPHVVELKTLDARLGMADDGWVRVRSATGIFDNQKELLTLPSAVRIVTNSGYDANLGSATVEIKAGTVKALGPVTVESPDGQMASETLEIRNNGDEIVFSGRVRTTLIAERKAGERKGAGEGP